MNPAKIKALFKRELSDIFRDKKTLFVMIVLPLVLYPLMIVGMTLLSTAIIQNQQEKTYRVAFEDVPVEKELKEILKKSAEDLEYKIELKEDIDDASAALEAGELDAYLAYDGSLDNPYQVNYMGAQDASTTARSAVESLLKTYEKQLQQEKLNELGLDENEILHPIRYEGKNHSTEEQTLGNIMGDMLPMLIIVSIMMGAVYPAIDVTAGEKERGTLETLLTLPLTNFEMIMSKFLAVSVIACISAFFNILSMGLAFGFMLTYLTSSAESLGMQINLTSFVPAILFTLFVMMFFALFVTAVCMCICLFAKSFKEANNYVTPLLLVFMFVSMVPMMPEIKLDVLTAAIPVVNVSLMIADLFKMSYNYGLFGIVFLSNVVYSLLAVMVLAKVYNSESILFGEGMGSLKLFEKRSEITPGQIPGVGDVIFMICIQLLLTIYIGALASLKLGFGGTAVTQGLILIVPLSYLWYLKADMKGVLSLKAPKPLALVGAFILWIGVYALDLLISFPLMKLFSSSTESLEGMSELLLAQPLWALVVVVALMPAVGEELMFRGFIYGSLKDKTQKLLAMVITSAIFGIYHMSLIKFFTTFVLGFAFVMVLDVTESIFCTMMMHFLNNLLAVLSMKSEAFRNALPFLSREKLMVSDMLLLAGIALGGIAAGYAICRAAGKGRKVQEKSAE